MSTFIIAVAILSITIVVVQFYSYFGKRRREGTAGTPGQSELAAGVEAFGSDAEDVEAAAPSE